MRTLVNMLYGSHLYGLDTLNSDIDYKGIFLPIIPELLLNNYPGTIKSSTGPKDGKNTAGDIDREMISLPKLIDLACKGETMAIDMLHCTDPLSSSEVWEDLVSKRHMFYTKDMKAFVGYVKRQAAKYGIKGSRVAAVREAIDFLEHCINVIGFQLSDPIMHVWDDLQEGEFLKKTIVNSPHLQLFWEVNGKKYQSTNTIEYVLNALKTTYGKFGDRALLAADNEGVDWKAMSHALRAGYQAYDIYTKGDFEYPLKQTEFLLDVKQGKLDFKTEVMPQLEGIVKLVEIAAENSTLPDTVNRDYWDKWLLKTYYTENEL